MINAKPFLKWAGGKQKLIPQINQFLPESFTYYWEPFLGGGAMFFHLQPDVSFLSDINEKLVRVYTDVAVHTTSVIGDLKHLQKKHSRDFYYEMRDLFNGKTLKAFPEYSWSQGSLFIYLNKTCFNGLYRVNQKGEFNVPYGRYKKPRIFDEENLKNVAMLMNSCAVIKTIDFLKEGVKFAKENLTEESFIYLDPPYYPTSITSNFTGYNPTNFGETEQKRLKDIVDLLTQMNMRVMVSNSDTYFIRELYMNYRANTIRRNGSINSDPSKRGKITELVITNY